MKTRYSLLLCGLLSAVLSTSSAWSQTVLKLAWTTSDAADDPYAIGARAFQSDLAQRTSELSVQLYPNRQLGDERQLFEGLRLGTVDVGIITNAVAAQLEPVLQINDLPFLYTSTEHAHYMEGGFRHMVNNKQPVQTPKDVESVKYRVMQNPVYIDMFNALGGSAVPMVWGETFTAVQQGTIDGLEIPLPVIVGNKYYEVTKYLSLTGHTYSVNLLLISKRALNKLTPQQRDAVLAAGKAATLEQRQRNAANVDRMIATAKERGMQVNQPVDFAPFQAAVRPMYESYSKRFGSELVDAALSAAN